jgi:dermatan 4-sulfotransferase 1
MRTNRHFILFERIPLMYGRVPKVANSSIKAALCRLLSTPPEQGVRTTADSFWRVATHGETSLITPKRARQHHASHFSFSFVRNPFDRLVSAYNNKIMENDKISEAMKAMGLTLRMSFDDFVDRVCAATDESLDVHLLPQTSILCVSDHLVPKFVGRMEHIDAHWQLLQERMRREGLPDLGKLPQKNVRRASGSSLTDYFANQILISKVAERYRKDLEFFYSDSSISRLAAGELLQAHPPLQSGGTHRQPERMD